ncbi:MULTISPECIES: sugar ABC transporter permease [Bacillus]|uniref:Autoinducer 2 import system permease protein LsrC n=2 Tax=Bacillus cereus group TaxID=86661 RepID=A0A2A7D837_BACAN|nr:MULTISPECIES: sugar ABC transporter permease [Bacillus]MCP1164121.1 sugar ABC transporter permease [Bacillus sp. 1813sda1]MDC7974964.1 sugar ABC transporter permease [Bacillus sp. BLCC-B18]OTW71848.1 sugar ABC transporter permease [Bacillus thuringiensis serovar coreanensis]OTX55468.1 sugar ABC transporter permease [Bacillus thuringiensis serovar sooncheon]OTX58805.1 sugar ABC transporter permease [Bacillus thuringiensis serovar guiyangiensis]
MKRMYKMHETSIILLLLIYIAIVGVINPSFVQFNSLSLVMKSSVILVLLAIGQSFVLFTKNIDVSVGSIMGLSAAVCGMLLSDGYHAFLSIFAAILLGSILGFINGIGVAKFRIPAIIMTLGMLGVIRGAMLIFTGGKWIEDIPNDFKQLSSIVILGLPIIVWVVLFILLLLYFYLRKVPFGRYFYAVGDNEDGARLIGIPVNKVKIYAFMISGISAALAGCIFVMNIGFVPNQTGTGIELQVIAAAVLGGVHLKGGTGSIVGAALGAIFLEVISSSLVFLKIPAFWNNAISGFLLLLIVILDSVMKKWKTERRMNL